MSRMEHFETSNKVSNFSDEFNEDKDIQQWLWMGRMAGFFCLWTSMAIPVLLIWSFRF